VTQVRTRSRQLDYKVHSNIEPHTIKPWCVESFGEQWNALDNRTGTWTCFWAGHGPDRQLGRYVYRFAESKDALWFELKWK